MGAAPLAARQKKARDLHATLGFTDESGFRLAPLTRRSLAPIARTPPLLQRARHRDKVSAAAALLLLSPDRGHARLYAQTSPDVHVDAEVYGFFLRHALGAVRGPLVVVHDRGTTHRGQPLRDLCAGFARLHLEESPPYAPELNPVEYLWNWCKDERLCDFAAHDVPELEAAAGGCLDDARHDQHRLRSFFESSPLPWSGTGLI